MKEEIKELKEILSDVTKRIEKLENFENDYELYLFVDEEDFLIICFDCNGSQLKLGYITDIGECYILSAGNHRGNYELWLQNGMKVKENNEVEWKENKYHITTDKVLRRASDPGIYDFEYANVRDDCKDDNIVRYSNGTPILY